MPRLGAPELLAKDEAKQLRLEDLLGQVDIVLDSTPGGVGRANKEIYQAKGVKAVFQGGEKNDIVDVFFHGYANYEKGVGKDYLKLTSCNTTGLIRAVDCLDREVGVERVRRGQPLERELRVPQDHPEHVVEVVRHAARELAHRLHLLRLGEFDL